MERKRERGIFHVSAKDRGEALLEILAGERRVTGNTRDLFPIKEDTSSCYSVLLLVSMPPLFVRGRFPDHVCQEEIRLILTVQVRSQHFLSDLHPINIPQE
jgi:hypothetical protein